MKLGPGEVLVGVGGGRSGRNLRGGAVRPPLVAQEVALGRGGLPVGRRRRGPGAGGAVGGAAGGGHGGVGSGGEGGGVPGDGGRTVGFHVPGTKRSTSADCWCTNR